MIIRHRFAILLLLFAATSIQAQQKSATFKGVFADYNKCDFDSVMIFSRPNHAIKKIDIYSAKVDELGRFNFSLPVDSGALNFSIYRLKSGARTIIGTAITSYYAERGDDIVIKISKKATGDSIHFYGRGSEKYALANVLIDNYLQFLKKFPRASKDQSLKQIEDTLNYAIGFISENQSNYDRIFDALNFPIKPWTKNLMYYTYNGFEAKWDGILTRYMFLFKNNPDLHLLIKEHLNKNFNDMIRLTKSDMNNIESPQFYSRLLSLIKLKSFVNSPSIDLDSINGNLDFKAYYNSVKSYSEYPIVREKLIMRFLLNESPNALPYKISVNFDSIFFDACTYLKSPHGLALKNKLSNDMMLFRAGTKVYDGTFLDMEDREFKLSSFNGKVVLLDMWSEGCSACAIFHKMFHKDIWPSLKENKDFIYLSINCNKDKDRWLRSLSSQSYSSYEYINASIGEKMNFRDHPLVKHYNIDYNPFILLIDKAGNIVSKVESISQPIQLLSMINKALDNVSIP